MGDSVLQLERRGVDSEFFSGGEVAEFFVQCKKYSSGGARNMSAR